MINMRITPELNLLAEGTVFISLRLAEFVYPDSEDRHGLAFLRGGNLASCEFLSASLLHSSYFP